MLALRLLGPPQILRDNTPVTVPRRKSRALLYYVAAQSAPPTRAHLLALLWPDLDRVAAQQSLRTTLHGLRRALGEVLLTEGDSLALAPGVAVDVRAFEAQVNTPEAGATGLRAVLGLYRGDFLEGFDLPDSAAFDNWLAAERERLRRLAVRGWTALAGLHEAAGDYAAGLEALEHALAFEPLHEELQRQALRLHYLAGDRAGAIRRYAQLRQRLDEEMGVLPMPETRSLYDAIVNDALPAPTPVAAPAGRRALPAAPLPFVGRDLELEALRQLAAEPPSARPLALLEGEPGIGKTRLAEEFMRLAGGLGLRGSAREAEQALPYLPIIEALRGLLADPAWPALAAGLQGLSPVWLGEVARLLPELDTPQPAPAADEARLWEGVHQFLLAVARRHPLVLFLDDAQWADASTLGLLNYVSRRARAEGAPIVFLAAARPAPRGSLWAALLQTLTREGRLLRLPLARLAEADVARLAAQWLAQRGTAGDPAPLAQWLASTSEGNPFVLTELLRHAGERGLVRPDGTLDPAVLDGSPVVPQSVYTLIQSSLNRLSEPARRVVDAAVAAGREFDFEVAYRAAGLTEAEALDALDELRAANWVHPAPSHAGEVPSTARFVFNHSLMMEVAYREVGEPRHRQMHRRVAEALEAVYGRQQLDAQAGVVAAHFQEGGAPERAAPYAFRAGQQAAGLAAWTEAVAFFEQALAAAQDDAHRLRAYMALADVHFNAGAAAQAAEAYQLALATARDLGDTAAMETAQLALGRTHLLQGRYQDAIRLAQSLRAAAATPNGTATAEFLWGTALSLEGADLAGAGEHLHTAERILQGLCEGGQPEPLELLAQVQFERGSLAAQQGDLAAAVGLYREALELARRAGTERGATYEVLAHNNLAYHLHLARPDDPEALAHAQTGMALAQERGLLGVMPYLYSTLGEIALGQGDVNAAERSLAEGLALAERLDIPERVAGLTANLGRVALARGETALALYRLSTALARAEALGTHHLAAQIRLWLAPLLPPAEARAHLAQVRAFAQGGRRRLLEEAERIEARFLDEGAGGQRA